MQRKHNIAAIMRVKLKIGTQMMCLRDMHPLTLCNGTDW